MARRRYTDDERATALAALTANGGNVSKTSKQLGIPEMTLRQWSDGSRHPEATQMSEDKKEPLSDACERIARQLADAMPKKIGKAGLQQTATSFAIMVDKMQLLRGKATSIQKHDLSELSDEELQQRFEEAARIADVDPGRNEPPQGETETADPVGDDIP